MTENQINDNYDDEDSLQEEEASPQEERRNGETALRMSSEPPDAARPEVNVH